MTPTPIVIIHENQYGHKEVHITFPFIDTPKTSASNSIFRMLNFTTIWDSDGFCTKWNQSAPPTLKNFYTIPRTPIAHIVRTLRQLDIPDKWLMSIWNPPLIHNPYADKNTTSWHIKT